MASGLASCLLPLFVRFKRRWVRSARSSVIINDNPTPIYKPSGRLKRLIDAADEQKQGRNDSFRERRMLLESKNEMHESVTNLVQWTSTLPSKEGTTREVHALVPLRQSRPWKSSDDILQSPGVVLEKDRALKISYHEEETAWMPVTEADVWQMTMETDCQEMPTCLTEDGTKKKDGTMAVVINVESLEDNKGRRESADEENIFEGHGESEFPEIANKEHSWKHCEGVNESCQLVQPGVDIPLGTGTSGICETEKDGGPGEFPQGECHIVEVPGIDGSLVRPTEGNLIEVEQDIEELVFQLLEAEQPEMSAKNFDKPQEGKSVLLEHETREEEQEEEPLYSAISFKPQALNPVAEHQQDMPMKDQLSPNDRSSVLADDQINRRLTGRGFTFIYEETFCPSEEPIKEINSDSMSANVVDSAYQRYLEAMLEH